MRRRTVQLISDDLNAHIPPLYATEHESDPTVWVHLFLPTSSWSWYVMEYSSVAPDGTPELAFGLVVGMEPELGYFSLAELAAARGLWGLSVERDVWWRPCPLSVVWAGGVS